MRENIGLGGFPLSIGWPGYALKSPGFQDFGAQDFKAEASRIALRGLDQPVQGFGVSVAHAMIEIGEDRLIPVVHGSQQWLERLSQMGRDAGFPVLVGGFRLGTAAFQPDIEKALLEPVGSFQVGKVLRPGFQDQAFGLVQISKTMQQDISVVHQPLALGFGEFRFDGFADRLKAFICHLDDMEMIDHHLGVWQDELGSVEIGTPHVYANQCHLVPIGQAVQVADDGCLVPISQKIDNASVANIANDTTGLVEQMHFVNTDSRAHGGRGHCRVFSGLGENSANGSFIDAYIISNARKGTFEGLLSEIEHQALCHGVGLIHIVKRLKERALAGATQVAFSEDQDAGVLASDRDIHEHLAFDFVPVQMGAATMRAARNNRLRFGGDLVTMRALFYAQNAPVCPSQNIQRSSPMLQVVESLFFLAWINTVEEGGKVKRLHYAFHAICRFLYGVYGRAIPRDMPDSPFLRVLTAKYV